MPIGMYGYPRVVIFKEKVYIGGRMTSSDRDGITVMIYEPIKAGLLEIAQNYLF